MHVLGNMMSTRYCLVGFSLHHNTSNTVIILILLLHQSYVIADALTATATATATGAVAVAVGEENNKIKRIVQQE